MAAVEDGEAEPNQVLAACHHQESLPSRLALAHSGTKGCRRTTRWDHDSWRAVSPRLRHFQRGTLSACASEGAPSLALHSADEGGSHVLLRPTTHRPPPRQFQIVSLNPHPLACTSSKGAQGQQQAALALPPLALATSGAPEAHCLPREEHTKHLMLPQRAPPDKAQAASPACQGGQLRWASWLHKLLSCTVYAAASIAASHGKKVLLRRYLAGIPLPLGRGHRLSAVLRLGLVVAARLAWGLVRRSLRGAQEQRRHHDPGMLHAQLPGSALPGASSVAAQGTKTDEELVQEFVESCVEMWNGLQVWWEGLRKPGAGSIFLIELNAAVFAVDRSSKHELSALGRKDNELILKKRQLWRLLTPVLLHGSVAHLTANCSSIKLFGPTAERLLGRNLFFGCYVLSALTGNIFSIRFCENPSLGASGAVLGIMGALSAVYVRHLSDLNAQGHREYFLAVVESSLVNFGLSKTPDSRTDYSAHLGGFVGGFCLVAIANPGLDATWDRNEEEATRLTCDVQGTILKALDAVDRA